MEPKRPFASGLLADHPRLLALFALMLFALSLMRPVAQVQYMHGLDVIDGWGLLVMGWLGAIMLQFGWWANPCFALALFLLLRGRRVGPRTAMIVAVALTLLLADALRWRNAPNDASDGPIVAYLSGYWLWCAAMAAAIVALVLRSRESASS